MLGVAFQGEPGAYSEAAAFEYFGPSIKPIPCESFDKVFELVNNSTCQYGLIPVENSLAGSIHRNYDLLLQNNLSITGEYYLRVKHCLIANPGTQISDIKKIISHPQALAQCEKTIRSLPGVVPEVFYDTAGSVKALKEMNTREIAAIASRRAAEVYDMHILKEGIEDNPANFTRFLAIAIESVPPPPQNAKTSIVFSLRNQPGALFKALSVFALRDIDLSKIESRPIAGKLWEYSFYIDFGGAISESKVQRALDHLGEYALTLRVLGSYPKHLNWNKPASEMEL